MQNCILELDHEISRDCNLIYNENQKYESYLKSAFYFDFIESEIDNHYLKSKYLLEILLHTPAQLFEEGYFFGDDQTSLISAEKLDAEYRISEIRGLLTVDHEAMFDYNFKSFMSWLSYIKPASAFISEGEIVNLLVVEKESSDTGHKRVLMNLAILIMYSRSFQESEIEQILIIFIYCFDNFFSAGSQKTDLFVDYKEDVAFLLFYALIYKRFNYQTDSLTHFVASFQMFQTFFSEMTIIGYKSVVEICLENINLKNKGISSNALAVVGEEQFLDNDLYKLIMALRLKFPVKSLRRRLIEFIRTYYKTRLLPTLPSVDVPSSKLESKLAIVESKNEISKLKEEYEEALAQIQVLKEKNLKLEARASVPAPTAGISSPQSLLDSEAKDVLIQLKDRKIQELKERLKVTYDQQLYLYNHGRLARKKGEFLLSEEMALKSLMRLLGAPERDEDEDDVDGDLIIETYKEVQTDFRRSLSFTNYRIAQNVYKYYANNNNGIFETENSLKAHLLDLGVYFSDDKGDSELLYNNKIEGHTLQKLERKILRKLDLKISTSLQKHLQSYKDSDTHKEIQSLIPEMSAEVPSVSDPKVNSLLQNIPPPELDDMNDAGMETQKQGDIFWKVATDLHVSSHVPEKPLEIPTPDQDSIDEADAIVVTTESVNTAKNLTRSDFNDFTADSLTTKNVEVSSASQLEKGDVIIGTHSEEDARDLKRQKLV